MTVVGSRDRAEGAILGMILAESFLVNSDRFCSWGVTLWCRNPLLSSNTYIEGHFMKIEWFVTNVTAVGSPGRAEHAILGVILVRRFLANSGRICGQGATL